MTIAVYKQLFPFGGYSRVANNLKVRMIGAPYVLLPGHRTLPVSDELAAGVLGARRTVCPHVGKEPGYGLFDKSEFKAYETYVESMIPGYVKCQRCGYNGTLRTNPRFSAAFGDGPGDGLRHPYFTYWVADRQSATITDAEWDGQYLTLASGNGTLVVWLCGRHLKKDGAKSAALERFPRGKIVHERRGYFLIQA